ncbi:MAG: UPF0182 family protein [Acidobacteria bacterium]|nr:UPF0182 family protein [Acidobacteriota bacterium]
MKSKRSLLTAIVLTVGLFGLAAVFVQYYGDWLWFGNLGYATVFDTMLVAKVVSFAVFFLLFAIAATVNIAIAWRNGPSVRPVTTIEAGEPQGSPLDLLLNPRILKIAWAIMIFLFSCVMGLAASGSWDVFLKFLHASRFGITDPIFAKDVGFYVFTLPVYQFIQGWYLLAVVLIAAGVIFSYNIDRSITLGPRGLVIGTRAKHHLAVLGGFLFLGIVLLYRLKLYGLMYSTTGVAYGASYTDVHAFLPAYWVLLLITAAVALMLFLSPVLKRWKVITYLLGAYVVVLVLFTWVYPTIVQQYVVRPNEFVKEKPYIKNNIRLTRRAYGLNKIEERHFPVVQDLTYRDIQNNAATVANIRLWDRRPLIQTYKQLQEIRLYYDFKNVDVDRYRFGKTYLQVALAARELPESQIPLRARTWVNIHLIYTHGFGVVMNPVNQVTADGMPRFIVKNIPPQASVPLTITEPRIYFGEETDTYAIVRSKTREFDYPKGNQNVYTTYHGKGGVPIAGWFRRTVYAWKLSDVKILLTDAITAESRLMYNRRITVRDRTIAPFLSYDSDPYLVVGADGRLYWIHDAYTTTNMFPYSEPVSQSIGERGLNYIRNSVKVVIDAYNGDVSYYVVDPSDPLIQTYEKIFPALFKPLSAMPVFLRKHIRYPMDLFVIMAHLNNTYHMTDPQVFYNREDLWTTPSEIYQEQQQRMLPYYIVMKLPHGTSEEFILMLPLTPSKKDNMVAWMCARCDTPNYGEIIVYDLPKERLIYGPMQIEARINQKPSISSELTLWGQKGSRVIRGNMLVIPIEKSFIYVEPVYLQAEQSEMPELKRVIVSFKERLEMERNLDLALRVVFNAQNVPAKAISRVMQGQAPAVPLTREAQKALDHYNKAMDALKRGDWSGYGAELKKLRALLEKMVVR